MTPSSGTENRPATTFAPGALRPLIESWQLSLRAANKSAKTIDGYSEAALQLAAFLDDVGMPSNVDALSREHCEAFIVSLYDAGKSPATVSNRFRALQQLFKWLQAEGEIARNPMANMTSPKVPEKLVPVLDDAQLRALFKTCSGASFNDVRDRALLFVLLDTGLRRAECSGLRLDDIDRHSMTLRVVRKGRREALVPVGAKAMSAVDRYLRARARHPRAEFNNALWLGHRGPITDSGIAQIVEKRGEKAGIQGLHAHALRHTFAHHWLADGGGESDLMQLAGWRSRQMLNRYGASAANERARDAHRQHSLGDRL
jgi:site-specific recombinase XerD